MAKKRNKKRQQIAEKKQHSNDSTERSNNNGQYPSTEQVDQTGLSTVTPFYRRSTFWGLVIAFASLVVAIALPVYLTQRAEKKLISQVNHQLIVQPVPGTKTEDGYSRWTVALMVMNRGPAAVKTSVTTMQFPQIKARLVAPPVISDKPVGGEIEIETDIRNGWVQIAVKNMTYRNGFAMQAELEVTQSERHALTEWWERDPFDAELVRRFIYFVSTAGEDIISEYGGGYPIPRWIGE